MLRNCDKVGKVQWSLTEEALIIGTLKPNHSSMEYLLHLTVFKGVWVSGDVVTPVAAQ